VSFWTDLLAYFRRKPKVRVSVSGSAAGSVVGRGSVTTLERGVISGGGIVNA
jgi:hypothetical protein